MKKLVDLLLRMIGTLLCSATLGCYVVLAPRWLRALVILAGIGLSLWLRVRSVPARKEPAAEPLAKAAG